MRQRWLENATGQWLSVDPVASEPRYGYAGNSPTLNVDPLGTRSMRDVARQDIAAAERQIRRGGHWADQQISRGSHWADQQIGRAIPWVEQEIQGPWMGHSLVSLAEEGVRWAERRFGNGYAGAGRPTGTAAPARRSGAWRSTAGRSGAGRHTLSFGHENSGRAPPGWLQMGLNAARQVEAVVGNAVRLTIHVAEGVTRRVIIDPLTAVVEAVSPGAKQLYARASQTWPRFTSIISQIWNTLERVFLTTTSHRERIRRGLPPILANVAPPPPTDAAGVKRV